MGCIMYKIEVIRWKPDEKRENLGEHIFKEKPLIGDQIHLHLKVGSETVEALHYFHSVFPADSHGKIPRTAESMTTLKLFVKRIEYHSEQPFTEDGYTFT
jgi:hypothetical protein